MIISTLLRVAFTAFLSVSFFYNFAFAEAQPDEPVIGIFQLPIADVEIIERRGEPKAVMFGDEGKIGYEQELARKVVQKFPVFSEPDEKSEHLVDVDISGAFMEIVAVSGPGLKMFEDNKEMRDFKKGQSQLNVFEQRENWLRIKFRDQLPWNGRAGWLHLNKTPGAFIKLGEK